MNHKRLLLIFILFFLSKLLAQQPNLDRDFIRKNYTTVDRLGSNYQQYSTDLIDYNSDKILLDRTIKTKKAALSLLNGNTSIKTPSRANPLVYEDSTKKDSISKDSSSVNIEGMTNPINLNGFINMLNQVLLEESRNLNIHVGKFHRWSDQIKKEHPFSLFLKFPKVLIALAQGDTSKFLYTGSEEELILWILNQSHESITPEMMFRTSLKLNKGNVYLTILTIENVLSKFWFTADRDNTKINVRLKSFHNQLGTAGDKFGFWYHFFGLLLQSYCYGKQSALFSFQIESLISDTLAKEPDYQEDYSGHYASLIGDNLRKSVQKNLYLTTNSNVENLKLNNYTNLNEDYFLRLPYQEDKDLSVTIIREKSIMKLVLSHKSRNINGCSLNLWFKGSNGHPNYSLNQKLQIHLNNSGFFKADLNFQIQNHIKAKINCKNESEIVFERKIPKI